MTSPADVANAIRAYNEGVRAMQEGDSEAAAAAWRQAAELDPGMTPALRNLVVFYEERDRIAEVVQTYDKILAYDPYDTEALVRQASAYHRTGRSNEAIGNYEKAIAVYPYFRFWYDELATIYDQIGETETGEAWRDRALELDSDEAEMAFEDGVRHARSGNSDLAIAIFEAVIEDQPANLEARIRLARLLEDAGRADEARAQLDAALDGGDAGQALVRFHRARLLASLGEREAALEDLGAALAEEPGFGRARRMLERLGGPSPERPPGKSDDIPPVDDLTGVATEAGSTSNLEALAPRLAPPDADAPWHEQLLHVIRQAGALESRTGQPGRIAVLLQADARLVPASDVVLQLVTRPDLGFVGDDASRVYVIEGEPRAGVGEHGLLAEGWFGRDYQAPDHDTWVPDSDGLPVDAMLEAAQLAVGSDGFNLVLIVGTGAIRSDSKNTLSFLSRVPTYQYALVLPTQPDPTLFGQLDGVVPNLVTIVASS